jgi:hypothetical protein
MLWKTFHRERGDQGEIAISVIIAITIRMALKGEERNKSMWKLHHKLHHINPSKILTKVKR